MSAYVLRPDWQTARAIYALAHGLEINLQAYASEFELDLDETFDLFEYAASHLGMVFERLPDPVLH